VDRDLIITILVAIFASNGFFALVQFLITRHDTKKNIKDKLIRLEKDGLRTQLLLMVLLKPNEKKEILTLAQHYFVDLKGNWYMTDIFDKWLLEKGDSRPEWFKKDEPSL
jgi:hypothetical protein